MRIARLVGLLVLVGALAFAPTAGAQERIDTPQGAADALSDLTPEQERALGEAIQTIAKGFSDVDLPDVDLPALTGELPDLSLPQLDTSALQGLIPPAPSTKALPRTPGLGASALPPVSAAASPLDDLVGDVQALLDTLTFTWVSTCNGVTKTHTGILLVPTPLNVCGNFLPDVLATITATSTSGGTISITKLPITAPASMPLRIEAVIDDPTAGSTSAAAFGYDAIGSNAPKNFTAQLALTSGGGQTGITINTTTAGAGPRLALIGEVFQEGAGGARTKPQRVRLGYAPVPATAGIALRAGGDDASATLTNSSPTTADLLFDDRSQTSSRRALAARIDKLPGSLSLSLNQDGAQRTLAYRASAPVGSIGADLRDFDAADAVTDHVALELAGLPTQIDVTQPTATSAQITTNGAIGSVFAGVASGGTVERLTDPAYLYTKRTGGFDSLALRLLGLRSATLSGDEPLKLAAELAPGPFHALVIDGARRLDAAVRDLPSSLNLEFDPANGKATYTGSAPIGEVVIDATDPAGLSGRATDLDLRVTGVPTSLTLDFAQSGDAFGLTTAPATLGSVELLLDDGQGAPAQIPADRDGLLLRDTPATYQVAARITSLRTVSVRQRPTIDFLLDSTANRILRVDLAQQGASGPQQTVLAEIDRLSPNTHITFVDDPVSGRTLTYTADQPVDKVDVTAAGLPFAGRADNAQLNLTGLPRSLTLNLGRENTDRIMLDAGTGLGSVFARLTSGPAGSLSGSGVQLIDNAAQYTLVARMNGLKKIDVRQRPSIDLILETTAPQAFRVFLQQSQPNAQDQTIVADILDLPASLRLQFLENAAGRQLVYNAGSPVGRITLDANHLPLSGRADRLIGDLQGLPLSFTLNLGTEGGNVDLNAGTATIGSIEALLTSGPTSGTILVPAGMDGVRLTDIPTVYAIAARISQLRRVTARQNPIDLFLDSTAQRLFNAKVDTQATPAAKREFTEATLNTLKPSTRIQLDDSGGRTQLTYSAASAATRLDLATNSGDRELLTANIAPIPASVTACAVSASPACGNPTKRANKMSLRLTASEPATVNLDDCQTPGCGERITLTNLRLRRLELNLHTEPICLPFVGCGADGAFGEIWFDTDGLELTGQAFLDTGSVTLTARFPPGFDANNRFVEWDGPFTDSTGSIDCEGTPGDGQDLDLDLDVGITVDVAFILC